jgi:hypothetical protein
MIYQLRFRESSLDYVTSSVFIQSTVQSWPVW